MRPPRLQSHRRILAPGLTERTNESPRPGKQLYQRVSKARRVTVRVDGRDFKARRATVQTSPQGRESNCKNGRTSPKGQESKEQAIQTDKRDLLARKEQTVWTDKGPELKEERTDEPPRQMSKEQVVLAM